PSASPVDIAREVDAQIERARRWGVTPAYLECGDDHPAVTAALHRASQQTGAPARMTAWGVQRLVLPPYAEKPREPAVCEALTRLMPGTYLWVTQPAQAAPETWAMWGEAGAQERQADLQALCSAGVR